MTTTARITLEQFLSMPEVKRGTIASNLDFFLRLYLRQHQNVRIGPEMRCVFGPPGHVRALVPDLAVVDRKRLPHLGSYDGAFRGAPDLTIEILSPEAARPTPRGGFPMIPVSINPGAVHYN